MNSIIAKSYLSTLDPFDQAFLYLDYAGEGAVVAMRESDGLYPSPESAIRYEIPATATLEQVKSLFADPTFQSCAFSLCNLEASGHDWRVLGELFMLVIHKHLPGFDICQNGNYRPEAHTTVNSKEDVMQAYTGWSFSAKRLDPAVKAFLYFDFVRGNIATYRDGEDPPYPAGNGIMRWELPSLTTGKEVHNLYGDPSFRPTCERLAEGDYNDRVYRRLMEKFFGLIQAYIPGFVVKNNAEIF